MTTRPFEPWTTQSGGQILESAPFATSPVEERDLNDLERVPTAGSSESGPAPSEREKPGKLGKLVHRIKARAANRHHHADDHADDD
jgi:hypothetical protein